MRHMARPSVLAVVAIACWSSLLASCVADGMATLCPPIAVESGPTMFAPTSSLTPEAPEPTATPKGGARAADTRPHCARALVVRAHAGTGRQIDIVLDGLKDLYGAEVHLTFDPSVVQVHDADPDLPGTQVRPGAAFSKVSSFVALNRVDNQRGTIDFAVTLLGDTRPLQGRIVLASFELLAIKEGTTEIGFAKVLLADPHARLLRVVSDGIALEVEP